MTVTWSAQARRDLDSIHAYIAREADLARALAVVSDIVEAANRLGLLPGMGRAGARPGTRELVLARHPYVLPYRVRGQQVIVLRVLHSARRRP